MVPNSTNNNTEVNESTQVQEVSSNSETDTSKVEKVIKDLASNDEKKVMLALISVWDLANDTTNSKILREKDGIKYIVEALNSEYIETIENAGTFKK